MTKVNVRPPAAAPAPALAAVGEFFIDARGRRIGLRTPSIVEQLRLLRMLGGENSYYYEFCARLARVASIDGDPVAIPQKAITFEHLAQRLGEEGVAALIMHLVGANQDAEGAHPAKAEGGAQDQREPEAA